MKKLWLDFESFWADDFTLKKISPIEYINSQRFEALGCGFVDEGNLNVWVDGPDLPRFFKDVDWPNTFAISHNALFDAVILSARYGIVPGKVGDTLSMARNWLSHRLKSLSLGAICKFYGLPDKMDTVHKTKGINYYALRQMPDLYEEVKTYAIDDASKCKRIFNNMMQEGFPEGELEVIDMVIRMATQPKFELDMNVLAEHLGKVKAEKQALLDAAFIDKDNVSSIMSDMQLAGKLLMLGVDPVPMKVSKTTGKMAYAFAKTDKAFQELLEHEEPMVQAIVAARIGHKTTLEETRTERLMAIGRVTEAMPIPLKYSGAHTHRFSGDWRINLQNLRRGGELRKAFKAPPGKKVVAIDASQIECRFNAELSGEKLLTDIFRGGYDAYAWFAKQVYGYDIVKAKHPIERFVGKTAVLSLGYGSSWPVFQAMCRNQGNVNLTDGDSQRIVYIYRALFSKIVANWKHAGKWVLPTMRDYSPDWADQMQLFVPPGEEEEQREGLWWGPVRILSKALLLPNGNRLRYDNLAMGTDQTGSSTWTFTRGEIQQHIYGAKVVENVIQALAFVHIMETALRVKQKTGGMLWPAHQVHDELIYIVDEVNAELVKQLVVREMSKSPVWMPNAPLAAEGHIGDTYFDAK